MSGIKYKRILLKLSGEALKGQSEFGVDPAMVKKMVSKIAQVHAMGIEIAIVVGGGNFWRGQSSPDMDRTTADHMGMLATVINALALQDAFEQMNIPTNVQTAIEMRQIAEPYIRRKATAHLTKGKIVIFAAGTGNPFFTTDTCAALRAAEIDADVILLGKKGVDGVYDSDPLKNPDAKKYDSLTFKDILDKELKVMDATTASLCINTNIPIIVFGIEDPMNIVRVVRGEKIGTKLRG